MAATKEEIRHQARELGFVACAFTSVTPIARAGILHRWIEDGRHGSMDYLARDIGARTTPSRWLESARSIIVVAWPYPLPPHPSSDWRLRLVGRIASYALENDYHVELGNRLDRLASSVSTHCSGNVRIHVDAGPLVEKELAWRAGIGWFGRNTNLLLPRRGSAVLLGCILTRATFEPDPPFRGSHCGTCTNCVSACPTGALDAPPTIDACRCISYLTIEHRGPIARSLRAHMGNWLFGCDDCQEVCPWNEPRMADIDPWLEPPLTDLLTLSNDEFRDRYRHTAVWRTQRRGLARNVAIALGNSANEAAVDPLAEALAGDQEPLVRAHAAWALGRLGSSQACHALEHALRREKIPPVLEEIGEAIRVVR